jgi:uncharacterized protein (TIGR02246 family)
MSRTDIAAANRMLEDAAATGDLTKLANLYTRDAVVMPPDGPFVKGRDNIKAMWGNVAQQLGLKALKLETIDLQIVGDVAHELGEAHLSLGSGNAVAKYVVVWKKEDGQWRLHWDIWNTKQP